MHQLPVYMDHNATTPCAPEAVEAMLPWFSTRFGNASSKHHFFGWQAEAAVDAARTRVAELLGSEPGEIIFTSGATEAVNLAIKGVWEIYRAKGNHIITCATEHPAVLDTCRHLAKQGAALSILEVDHQGLIDLEKLESTITPETILGAFMFANNETGVIQNISEIAAVLRKKGVLFFSDATQAVGKVDLDVKRDEIPMLAFSAHKMYGPKGVGGLYISRKNPRVKIAAQMHGGGHEKGLRSGTLNVPGIVGLGVACEIAHKNMRENAEHCLTLRNKLEQGLLQLENSFVNGHLQQRLSHVTNICFPGVDSDAMLAAWSRELAVSSGSACTSAVQEPSHVLNAMGLSDEHAYASIRFSLGRNNTREEVDSVVKLVSKTVMHLRQLNTGWTKTVGEGA